MYKIAHISEPSAGQLDDKRAGAQIPISSKIFLRDNHFNFRINILHLISRRGNTMSNYFKHFDDTVGILLLAFIGGFIDAAGYLELKGVFTSSITGNVVVAATAVAGLNGVLCRSMVTISFTLAAGIGCGIAFILKLVHKFHLSTIGLILLALELGFILASWGIGVRFRDDISSPTATLDEPIIILVASVMGASMGFQNIAVKEMISAFPATTVMTSTLVNFAANGATSFGYYISKILLIRSQSKGTDNDEVNYSNDIKTYDSKSKDFFSKLISNIKPLVVFTVGALIGAATINATSFWCMCIPSFIIIILMIEIAWKRYEVLAIESAKFQKHIPVSTVGDKDISSLEAASPNLNLSQNTPMEVK